MRVGCMRHPWGPADRPCEGHSRDTGHHVRGVLCCHSRGASVAIPRLQLVCGPNCVRWGRCKRPSGAPYAYPFLPGTCSGVRRRRFPLCAQRRQLGVPLRRGRLIRVPAGPRSAQGRLLQPRVVPRQQPFCERLPPWHVCAGRRGDRPPVCRRRAGEGKGCFGSLVAIECRLMCV